MSCMRKERLKLWTTMGTVSRCTTLRGTMISFADRWESQVTTEHAQ